LAASTLGEPGEVKGRPLDCREQTVLATLQ
jgi:hypothetical protein